MKKTLIFFCSLLLYSLGIAQSAQPVVISVDGDYVIAEDSTLSIAYTVGEVLTQTLDGGSFKFTQGFHQPNLIITAVEDLWPELKIELFPNPSINQVNIKLQEELGQLQFQLFDLKGQSVSPIQDLRGLDQRLNLSSLPSGNYFLYIKEAKTNKSKSFKITKIQ